MGSREYPDREVVRFRDAATELTVEREGFIVSAAAEDHNEDTAQAAICSTIVCLHLRATALGQVVGFPGRALHL